MNIQTIATLAIFILLLIAFVLWRCDVAETERRRWYRRFRCIQEINAKIQQGYLDWCTRQSEQGKTPIFQSLRVLNEVDLSGFGLAIDDWLTPPDYAKMEFDWRRFHPDVAKFHGEEKFS